MPDMLASRIRGSLYGALAGDCLGALFEENVVVHHPNFTDEQSSEAFNKRVVDFVTKFPADKNEKLLFTDDTSMARSILRSLIHCLGFDAKHMARTFCDAYDFDKSNPWRSYGNTVPSVFQTLKDTHFGDIFGPATKVFNGAGSSGNGAAMRVVPVPLFYAKNEQKTDEISLKQARITHAHPDGIMGGVVQAEAVHIALNASQDALNVPWFIVELKRRMETMQSQVYTQQNQKNPYIKATDHIAELLAKSVTTFEVANTLGNSVLALKSVPSAVFSFLWCTKNRQDTFSAIENRLVRTIAYAICLGGDTDTIATMAGAIAGAYYGDQAFPESWGRMLEGFTDYQKYADEVIKHIVQDE